MIHDCGTCGRHTVTCPECSQPYPHGQVGHLDPNGGGWRPGPRPTATTRQTDAQRQLQRHQADADQAVEDWRRAAAELHGAQQQLKAQTTNLITSGGEVIERVPAGAARRIEQLVEAENVARERRDKAGKRLVQARQQATTAAA